MVALNANVIVRHPETSEIVSLAEGSEVPGWAAGLIGQHLIDAKPDAESEKPKRTRARGQ